MKTCSVKSRSKLCGTAYYASISGYQRDDGQTVYAAIFASLPPGNYETGTVYKPGAIPDLGVKKITVFPGAIAEVIY
jgi:hypothetical protein